MGGEVWRAAVNGVAVRNERETEVNSQPEQTKRMNYTKTGF